MPEDLTQLGDSALVTLLAQLGAWADFAGVQLAAAEVDEEELQRGRDFAEATSMVRAWEGAGDRPSKASDASVTAAKARRVVDPEVQEIREAELQKYAHRKILQAMHASLERKSFIVSREITRRTGGESKTRRAERWKP